MAISSQPPTTSNSAVGVFDSGFGGLSIVNAIRDLLPFEHIEYFGDSARYPYGSKSLAQVRAYAVEVGDYLVYERGVKALVVACNTASAAALGDLSMRYELPVVGTIDAGVRAACEVSERGHVGVIGTVGTIGSGAYQGAFECCGIDLSTTFQACPGLVEFVEKGDVDSEEVLILLRVLLEPLRLAKVDTLLLGCTHYPFLSRAIASVLGEEVVLVSSAEETAFEIGDLLSANNLTRVGSTLGETTIFCSGDPDEFGRIGSALLDGPLGVVCQVGLEERRDRGRPQQ